MATIGEGLAALGAGIGKRRREKEEKEEERLNEAKLAFVKSGGDLNLIDRAISNNPDDDPVDIILRGISKQNLSKSLENQLGVKENRLKLDALAREGNIRGIADSIADTAIETMTASKDTDIIKDALDGKSVAAKDFRTQTDVFSQDTEQRAFLGEKGKLEFTKPRFLKLQEAQEANTKKFLEVGVTQRKREVEDIYKTNRLTPKIEYLTNVGARSYKEVINIFEDAGIPLRPGRGINAIAFGIAMETMDRFEIITLKDSVKKMKLEVGTELMRTLGAFRNPKFAKEFGATLGEFSGNPYKDIDNVVTTLTKSFINQIVADDATKNLPRSEKRELIEKMETMAYYQYSKMFVDLGVIPGFHFGILGTEDVVERLGDYITEHPNFQAAKSKSPSMDEEEFKLKFFMKGAKEGWL